MQKRRAILPDQAIIQLIRYTAIVISLYVLSACTAIQKDQTAPVLSILPVTDSSNLPPVISDLMNQADDQYYSAQYDQSLATLERAVRIKPRHAEIWSRMAKVYFQKQQFAQAIQHAQRSNSYIKKNDALMSFNNGLIESAGQGQ